MNDYVFFLGGHDAEMCEIRKIFEEKGIPFHDKNLSWGARLSEYKAELEKLPDTQIPVFVELKLDCAYPERALIIDHHGEAAGEDKPTSLEQVAGLLGVELDRRQRLIAANDRGYIDAMLELCATQDEVKAIRKLDQDCQGVTEKDRDLAEKSIEKKLKKITPCAVVIDALTNRTAPIFDALYDQYEYIFIRTPDHKFHYAGSGKVVEKLKEKYAELSKTSPGIEFWYGGNLPERGYFGANKIIGDKEIEMLLDRDSNQETTPMHRAKIDKFCTMFIYPFYFHPKEKNFLSASESWKKETFKLPKEENELKDNWDLQRNYSEYIYFHEYIRSFLFPFSSDENGKREKREEDDAVSFYRYDFKGIPITTLQFFRNQGEKPSEVAAVINGVYAFIYPGDVGILVVETSNTADRCLTKEEKALLKKFPMVSTGSDLLYFNQMFRRLYPAYFEKDDPYQQIKNNEFPALLTIKEYQNGKSVSEISSQKGEDGFLSVYMKKEENGDKAYPVFQNHIKPLLTTLLGEGVAYYPILDDRMLVYCYVAFQKCFENTSKHDKDIYFSHLLFVDNPGKDYRYAREFTENLIREHTYERWSHYGTKIGFSRYSAAFLYFGYEAFLYRPFVSMNFQMFLLATYYRARLVRFADEIATIAKKWPTSSENKKLLEALKRDLRVLHTEFMRFMNVHWFVEVTHQDQGIELFHLIRKAFQLDTMYSQVKEEIERADDLVEVLHNENVEKFNTTAGHIGVLFGIIAILSGYFGMNFDQVMSWGKSSWLFVAISFVCGVCFAWSIIILFRLIFSKSQEHT